VPKTIHDLLEASEIINIYFFIIFNNYFKDIKVWMLTGDKLEVFYKKIL